eukprot:Em0012g496a
MEDGTLSKIMAKCEALKKEGLEKAEEYLRSDDSIVSTISESILSRTDNGKLFQWLHYCAITRHQNYKLFAFVLQFIPDLIVVYLYAIYESDKSLRARSEALLRTLSDEMEKEGPFTIEVANLSKSSIYHEAATQVSSVSLTEGALQRHNLAEVPRVPVRPTFSGKEISVNNRLQFLATLVEIFTDHVALYPTITRTLFCKACIRLSLQGMGDILARCPGLMMDCCLNLGEIGAMRRYSVDDQLVTSLLHGVRLCLFQMCHDVAIQALQALKLRAEYELLTLALQVSHALVRLTKDVRPLDTPALPSLVGDCRFVVNPISTHEMLNGHILQCKCNTTTPQVLDLADVDLAIESLEFSMSATMRPRSGGVLNAKTTDV